MGRAIRALACVGVLCGAVVCAWGGLLPGPGKAKTAATADWPGWRGQGRDGKSPDAGLLKAWPEGGPKRLWTVSGLGHGYSNVAVVANRIYATGIVGRTLTMFCFDATGEERWRTEIGPGFIKSTGGSRSTPMVDGGRVYIESGNGLVGCYSAGAGKKVWTRNLSEFGGRVPGWGHAESVLIAGDLAVVTPGGKSCMVALNKVTGKTEWQSPAFGGAQYGSPIHFTYHGVGMIVTGTQKGIVAVDAKTGRMLWSDGFSANNTANCPTPVFVNGRLFWATGYGRGGLCLSIFAGFGETTATRLWTSSDMDCKHGGFVIVGGHVYGNDGSGWSCLDLVSGETKWHERGVGRGSLCYADGMLYLFGESGGKMALVEASPEGYKPSGELRVRGAGPSWAHPVVIGGKLYLRYDERLYCFDVRDRKAAATAR